VTFLGQRQQQFKLVDQKAASRSRSGNEYHDPRRKQVKATPKNQRCRST
jgi:hypothetical protein